MNMAAFNKTDTATKNSSVDSRQKNQDPCKNIPPETNVQADRNEHRSRQNTKENTGNNLSSNPFGSILSGLFKDVKLDNEKLLLIGLAVILAKEGADIKLLFALIYIML